MEFEIIKTERLQLKKYTPEIYNTIFTNYSEAEIKELISQDNDDEYLKQLKRFKAGFSSFNRSFVYFQLIEAISNKIIGGCGFHNWTIDHNRAELGYALDNDMYKNKGYMTEALHKVIEYGFERMYLNRIEACVGPGNIPSLRLVEKFGFSREGLLREHFLKDGIHVDSLIFSLLKSEYRF